MNTVAVRAAMEEDSHSSFIFCRSVSLAGGQGWTRRLPFRGRRSVVDYDGEVASERLPV
jgi:hypothetical protein